MPTSFKNSFINGTDIDNDELRVRPNTLRFLKNLLWNVNRNSQASATEGNNAGVLTPLESNTLITGSISMPDGLNYCCGYKESQETNEGFVFVYNTRGKHFIYSINGENGTCQIVYANPVLNFQYNPEHFINDTRCVVRVVNYINPKTHVEDTRTFLMFTDNFNNHRFICKEDSIATNSFAYGASSGFFFPYNYPVGHLTLADEIYINLGIPHCMKCTGIEKIDVDSSDDYKQNLLVNNGFQFRIKNIDIYGRESEHGVISNRFFLLTGQSCISNSQGLSRCIELTCDAGNPFIDKYQIEYRTCGGNTDLSVDSGWVIHKIVNKYKQDPNKAWYEQDPNPDINLIEPANTFTVIFCADQLTQPIDPVETTRLYNPLPIQSAGMAALNKGLVLSNNKRGFEPLSEGILNKINFTVTPPTTDPCENIKPRSITVYALISNPAQTVDRNGRIYYNSATNLYYFQQNESPVQGNGTAEFLIQTFRKGVNGFIGYLAGTNYQTISHQVVIYLDDYSEGIVDAIDTSRIFVVAQKFVFTVVPGKYVFRIASHFALPTEDYQKTSTHVSYTILLDPTITGKYLYRGIKKEIVIDVCDDDFIDRHNLLLIRDVANPDYGIVYGYLYESEKEKIPLELILIDNEVTLGSVVTQYVSFTDHNGYFFAPAQGGGVFAYRYKFFINDCVITNREIEINNSSNSNTHRQDTFVYHVNDVFPEAGRRYINGRLLSCDGKIGLPGIPIVPLNSPVAYTDSNGFYRVVLHNRYENESPAHHDDYLTIDQFDWTVDGDETIISQNGLCNIRACGVCEMCFANYHLNYEGCMTPQRTYDAGVVMADVAGLNKSGPQNGGRYGFGIVLHDSLGRCTFVQSTDNFFVDIPTLLQIKTYDFSSINFSIDSSFAVDPKFANMSFWITENLNWQNSLNWTVDRIEFVDGAGNVSASPTKIRIYYESIAEYSAQNNESVNSVWQFIDPGTTKPVLGDRIELLQKPDGTWYDKIISLLVRYDKEGKYVEVDYSGDLADLKEGTMVKLVRPRELTDSNIYFELCPIIRLFDGIPEIFTGTFNYIDSYFVNRLIPVPQYITDPIDPTKTDRSVVLRAYIYSFEHHSPSDFWGDHCKSKGRINVKDPYERQHHLISEVALSKALVNKSNFNGLSYYDNDDTETFNEQEWGAITAVVTENNTVLIICEHDNFIVGFNDTLVRTDKSGNIIAASIPDRFGAPQKKLGSNNGCLMRDINTIQKRNGVVIFLDGTKSKLVFNTFGDSEDISKITLTKSWIERAVKTVNETLNNSSSAFSPYFIGGIDPKNDEYYLTKFFAYRNPVVHDNPVDPDPTRPILYTNDLPEINLAENETLVYSVEKSNIHFKGFVSPTPEYYGTLEGYYKDKNMLQMNHAGAWSVHNADANGTYNSFFGVQCSKIIQVVCNSEPEEVKRFLWTEVYCKEHVFAATDVKTEAGQVSLIPALRWDKRDNFYTAEYLCDLNTLPDTFIPVATGANKLLDGDVMYGRWLETRYVNEVADAPKYCEVSAITINYITTDRRSE